MSTILHHSSVSDFSGELHIALLDDEIAAYELPSSVTLHQLTARGSLVASFWQLFRLVRELRPSCILSFLTRANIAAACAARLLRVPVALSERVNTDQHLGAGVGATIARCLVRLTYPLADRVICVSEGVANGLVSDFGVPRAKVKTIYNPVDLARISAGMAAVAPGIPDRPFVLAVGRLVPNKNFAMLIRAFSQAGIAPDLVILGDGPEREALERLAAELGVADRVQFPGFAANPYRWMAMAQAYVLPSNAEGFPNGLVEAMACGLPVVSTNCRSGPSEVLAGDASLQVSALYPAEFGLLVPPDNVEAMVEALRRLEDVELRQRYGGLSRLRAEQFSVRATVADYWKTLRALMPVSAHEAL